MQVQIKLEIVHNSHFWIEDGIDHNPEVCQQIILAKNIRTLISNGSRTWF